jgi:hypothetical protein
MGPKHRYSNEHKLMRWAEKRKKTKIYERRCGPGLR